MNKTGFVFSYTGLVWLLCLCVPQFPRCRHAGASENLLRASWGYTGWMWLPQDGNTACSMEMRAVDFSTPPGLLLQGREAQGACCTRDVFGNANVCARCAFCYLQHQASHGGNKLCRSHSALRRREAQPG